MLDRERYHQEMRDRLVQLCYAIRMDARSNLHGLSIMSESFMQALLNAAFGWNLRNANIDCFNNPGFDLIDDSEKLLVQVTATRDSRKIKATLSSRAMRDYASYRILFIVLGELGSRRSQPVYKNPHKLVFDPNSDIWYIDGLLANICQQEDIGRIRAARDVVLGEISGVSWGSSEELPGVYFMTARQLARYGALGDQLEAALLSFCTLSADAEATMRVVCAGEHYHEPGYRKAMEGVSSLLERSTWPIFFLASGGAGKTTMLIDLLLEIKRARLARAVYVDAEEYTEETLGDDVLSGAFDADPGMQDLPMTIVCIDNFARNLPLLNSLYSAQRHERLPQGTRIILADRTDWAVNALWGKGGGNYDFWSFRSKVVLLRRPGKGSTSPESRSMNASLKEFFNAENVLAVDLDGEARDGILARVVGGLSRFFDLQGDSVALAMSQLSGSSLEVAYQIAEFQQRYNALVGMGISKRARFGFLWDDWFEKLDGFSGTGVALRDSFKYAATMKLVAGFASMSMLAKVVGCSPAELRERVSESFPAGSSGVWVSGDELVFAHDALADLYFHMNPSCAPLECLRYLSERGCLAADDVLRIVKNSISVASVMRPVFSPADIAPEDLIEVVLSKGEYEAWLNGAAAIHEVDLARIACDACKASGARRGDVWTRRLNESFERLVGTGGYASVHARNRMWGSYFKVAYLYASGLPEWLLAYVDLGDAERRSVTKQLAMARKDVAGRKWVPREAKERLNAYSEQILRVLVSSGEFDSVACLELGNVLLVRGDYEGAREQFARKLEYDSACEPTGFEQVAYDMMSIINSYEEECKNGEYDFYRSNRFDQIISGRYKSLIDFCKDHGIDAVGPIASYAMFEKDAKSFRHALELLESLPDGYRKSLGLGMFYSSDNLLSSKRGQRYYDLSKAVGHYADAWRFLEMEKRMSPSMQMTVLYPLASALCNAGRWGDAREVCGFALRCKDEERIFNLIDSYPEYLADSASSKGRFPAILSV